MDKQNVFSDRLKAVMQEKRLTQEQLASSIGVTYQAIGAYLRGTSKPTLDTLTLLSRVLEVSADYLLGLSDITAIDTDIKNAAIVTGLSPDALTALHLLGDNARGVEIRNYLDALLKDIWSQYQQIQNDKGIFIASGLKDKDSAELRAQFETIALMRLTPLGAMLDYDRACHATITADSIMPLPIDPAWRSVKCENEADQKILDSMLEEMEHEHENYLHVLVDGQIHARLAIKDIYKTYMGTELLRRIEDFGGDDIGNA